MIDPNDDAVMAPETPASGPKPAITRRLFLKSSSAALASTGTVAVGTMAALDKHSAAAQDATPAASTPDMASENAFKFFNLHEAATVDAIVSRILPGTPDDPGAHEAGVVFYIDASLGGTNEGLTRKTYLQGPFSVTASEAPVPVEATSVRDIYEFVSVSPDLISRYGYQSVLSPQESYRRGLAFVDAFAQSQFESDFVDLPTEQQDEILTAMEEDTATEFEGPSGSAFFTRLRNDTIEGMFSDPMYGGNRNMAGWKLIGYPGAQRAYSPDDIKNPDFRREPISLAMLMANEGH